MDNKMLLMGIVVVTLISGAYLVSQFNEPRTYEDCILQNIPNAKNERAASFVRLACREKFPERNVKYTGER